MISAERITVEDMATRLGISAYSVRQMLEAGIIPGIKCGRLWLVNRTVFEEWWAAAGKK